MGWGSAIGSAIGAAGSLLGGSIAAGNSEKVAQMNIDAQREFAQNGIRWKVDDAKKAGIHPLYALGASTQGFSPVSGYGGDYGISDAAANLGQGFARAQQAKMTKEERDKQEVRDAIQDMAALEDLRQKKRMNDAQIRLADSEIFRNFALSTSALRKTGLPPAMPSSGGVIDGQGDSKSNIPGSVVAGGVDAPFNKYAWTVNPEGVLELQPSQDYAQAYEDKWLLEWIPWVNAFLKENYHVLRGKPLNGYVFDTRLHRWVPEPKFPEFRGKYTK